VDLEAAVIGKRRVEEPNGMREGNVLRQTDLVAMADAPGGSAPFADAVEREEGRLLERAGKERTGSVALMVVQKKDGGFRIVSHSIANRSSRVQFFFQPDRDRHAEAAEAL